MTKPDHIPQDIWDKASDLATTQGAEGGLFTDNYVLPLAEALLAERCGASLDGSAFADCYSNVKRAAEPFDDEIACGALLAEVASRLFSGNPDAQKARFHWAVGCLEAALLKGTAQ